ncbi:hypothetical protein ACFOGJ_13955 [Marinibaculum pumilum]|uniref:Uncharacterized protein n=1 Tax=Marinibaculum pumilum TaxID=1766165 RepID=A0ABV7L170_9PROT
MRIRALAHTVALTAALFALPPVVAMAQSEPKPVEEPVAELPTLPAVELQLPGLDEAADIEDPETGGMSLPGAGSGFDPEDPETGGMDLPGGDPSVGPDGRTGAADRARDGMDMPVAGPGFDEDPEGPAADRGDAPPAAPNPSQDDEAPGDVAGGTPDGGGGEAGAATDEPGPSGEEAAAPQPEEAVPLETLLGRWESDTGELVAVLTTAGLPGGDGNDGAAPFGTNVKLHTDRRVWDGSYIAAPGEAVAVRLHHRPEADEMNKLIPGWARRAKAGEVEWRIDLVPVGPSFSPRLKMLWYRQQIRWEESDAGERSAEVIDAGAPLEFDLAYVPIIAIDMQDGVRLEAYPVGVEDPKPLLSVLQHQPFTIAAVTNEQRAKEIGPAMEVAIRPMDGGGGNSVSLEADVPDDGIVRYRLKDPVSIANSCAQRPRYRPPVMSFDWMGQYFSGQRGTCLELELPAGGMVELAAGESAGNAAYRFQYYPSWVQATIALQASRMADWRTLFEAILRSDQPASAKEAAHQSLRLVYNYEKLMRLDGLTDLHRAAIGDVYTGGGNGPTAYMRPRNISLEPVEPGKGLVLYTPQDVAKVQNGYQADIGGGSSTMWLDALLGDTMDTPLGSDGADTIGRRAAEATLLAPGVIWQFCTGAPEDRPRPEQDRETQLTLLRDMRCLEQRAVYSAVLHAGREKMNALAKTFYTGVTFGMYEGVANFTPVGDLVVLFTGRTIYGQPATSFDYWAAAAGLGLEVLVGAASLSDMMQPMRFHGARFKGGSIPGLVMPRKTARYLTGTAGAAFDASRFRRVLDMPRKGGPRLVEVMEKIDRLPRSLSKAERDAIARSLQPQSGLLDKAMLPGTRDVPVKLKAPGTNTPPAGNFIKLQNELTSEFGADVGVSELGRGSIFTPASKAVNDGTVAGNYALWRAIGRELTELEGFTDQQRMLADMLAQRPESFRARAATWGVDTPLPWAVRKQRLRASGLKVATAPLETARKMRLEDFKALLDGGWVPEVVLDMPGRRRPVVLEDVLTSAAGVPEKVRFFDPKYGALVDMDAGAFVRRLVREGQEPMIRVVRASDPDLGLRPRPFGFARKAATFTAATASELQPSTSLGPNRVFQFKTLDGEDLSLRLGDFINDGRTNAVMDLPDFPELVARASKQRDAPGLGNELAFDVFGRKALEDAKLDPNLVGVPKQRGFYRRLEDGGIIEIVDRFKGEPAGAMLRKQGGKFTRGQAVAIEVAKRALNKAGLVWSDGHPGNFAFLPLPGSDRWRVVIFDPGGILPARGTTLADRARQARSMQLFLSSPDPVDLRRYQGNQMLGMQAFAGKFEDKFKRFIDLDAVEAVVDHPGVPLDRRFGAPTTPRLELSQPLIRDAAKMSDLELRRAFAGN